MYLFYYFYYLFTVFPVLCSDIIHATLISRFSLFSSPFHLSSSSSHFLFFFWFLVWHCCCLLIYIYLSLAADLLSRRFRLNPLCKA